MLTAFINALACTACNLVITFKYSLHS